MICPLKPGLICQATPKLAIESKCDCPYIPQCILYDHYRDSHDRPREVTA